MQDKKYNPFDKRENREYSREEELERFKANIAYKKTVKYYRPLRTKVIINNGSINKRYDADLPIPEGWQRGCLRFKKGNKNEQQGKQDC